MAAWTVPCTGMRCMGGRGKGGYSRPDWTGVLCLTARFSNAAHKARFDFLKSAEDRPCGFIACLLEVRHIDPPMFHFKEPAF